MKTIIKYASLLAGIILMQSCVKDFQDDINDGGWNHERSVINIAFENQIGNAAIDNVDGTSGNIELSINVGAQPDMSSVKLTNLELSYQAQSSVKVGDQMDFSSGKASFTVTSALGETRTYTIKANSFLEELVGTWAVQTLTIYGGTGPEYGGGAVMKLSDKPWCWNSATDPDKECDNKLTFTLEGVSAAGNPMGKCVNDAGSDNTFADFIFLASMNKEGTGDIDLKKFYRQIPEGESTWERDYGKGTITFTDKDGRQTTGSFIGAGDVSCGNGKTFTVQDNAFQFTLNGTDDWTNIYSDYDKFVKRPRLYWISVKKVE
ncbi:hypothetical protein [Prevotella sp. KH2C16]|uniref:hypothetical protein n=1 Tax=Prevotella sp. KH2C16 TaxID=1855325 RepID=UPI0008F049D5|nr:hypothetical protein [Prevotella sp. KH2C16]SFG60117.1 hypothetical protein SAMN05216383_12210 [Prevotella sp. KH2C16]